MRFKPMPRYADGAVSYLHATKADGVVGRQFIQPRVATRAVPDVLLDDVIGIGFSVLVWNNDPMAVLGDEAQRWLAPRSDADSAAAAVAAELGRTRPRRGHCRRRQHAAR